MTTKKSNSKTAFHSLLADYANYNEWATKEYVKWLKSKPAEKLEQEVSSSFSTIKKTLEHIWKTQIFWLNVLKEKKEPSVEEELNFQIFGDLSEFSLNEIFNQLITQSKQISRFFQSLSDTGIEEKVHVSTPWFESNQPRYELLQHCINHSTYHRGQIVTIGRNVGITDAPMTDFNFYLLRIK